MNTGWRGLVVVAMVGILGAAAPGGVRVTGVMPLVPPASSDPEWKLVDRGSEWSTGAAMNVARHSHGSAFVDGILYVVGGGTSGQGTTVEAYDPATNTWTSKAGIPSSRGGHAVVSHGGKIYMFGGSESGGAVRTETHVYDPVADAWTSATSMPEGRSGASAVLLGGKVHLFGGSTNSSGQVTNAVLVYDPAADSWSTATSMPTARTGTTAGVINGEAYVAGGDSQGGVLRDHLEIYDPATDSWRSGPSLPGAVASAAGGVVDGSFWVVGGASGVSPGASTWNEKAYRFDVDANLWTVVPGGPTSVKRHAGSCAMSDGKLYFTGGCNPSNVSLTSLEILAPTLSPAQRADCGMVYDSLRDRIVLFGGGNSTGRLNDTWEWNGSSWIRRTPATSPPARSWISLAYDSARGRTVLFGGQTSSGEMSDTWEWDGDNWTQVFPLNSPSPRRTVAIGYDPDRERVVLFGGYAASVPGDGTLSDTWEWDGTNWTQRFTSSVPGPREAASLCFDPLHGGMILFGGSHGRPGGVIQDMWRFDGSNWQQLNPAHMPPGRYAHAMVEAGHDDALMTFGGSYNPTNGQALDDTWEWDGQDWNLRDIPGPEQRTGYGMAYDAARRQVVLFSGFTHWAGGATRLQTDTWIYSGNTDPVANAGADRTLECSSAEGTAVTLDGTGSMDDDDDALTFHWDVESGVELDDADSATPTGMFPDGTTVATLTVSDGHGGESTDTVAITVADTTAPTLSASGVPGELWPPDHRMVRITPTVSVSDLCDAAPSVTLAVTSNEPDDGCGDGDTAGDIVIHSPTDIELRAERSGKGDGRIYTMVWTATDAGGNAATFTATVKVPKSSAGKDGEDSDKGDGKGKSK